MKEKHSIILIITILVFGLSFNSFAQTKGLIYKPANAGKSVLDPNLDGYVSKTDQGFMTDDETESEIPFVPLPVVGAGEPSSDNSAGPSCGFVDLVRSDEDETIYTYSDGTNLMFRFRLGGTAENSKGYTILVDTDQLFGSGSDLDYVSGNPGFEYEITLRTNFGVSIYDINNNTLASTEIGDGTVDRPYEDFAQKSIAGSTICGTDYFYDFYVPYADLPFSSSTPVRMVGGTTIAPKESTGFKMADLGGIDDDSGVTDDLFQDLIDVFPPTSGDDISGGTQIHPRATCPGITGPIAVDATSVSGTTTEVDGATIELFRDGTSQGTTLASGGVWTVSGISAAVAGEVFTATAKVGPTAAATAASNEKSTSYSTCNTSTVGATCADKVINTTFDLSARGLCAPAGSATPGATIQIKHNGVERMDAASGSSGGVSGTVTVNPDGGWNWKCNTNSNCGSGGSSCGFPTTGVFEITQTVGAGCPSEPLYYCVSATASDVPTIDATPTTDDTTISGTCGTSATVTWYLDDVSQSTATFSGTWSFAVSGLIAGEVIRVVAAESGECASEVSATVVTVPVQSAKPTIDGDYCVDGGSNITSVSGFSSEPNGSTITVYSRSVSGGTETFVGSTTTIASNGAWTVTTSNIPTTSYITATAQASGDLISDFATEVFVNTKTPDPTNKLTLDSPIAEGDDEVSGTTLVSGTDNLVIQLYIDNVEIDGATYNVPPSLNSLDPWTITGLSSPFNKLFAGGSATVTVTNESGGLCESNPSNAVIIDCQSPDVGMSFAATSATTICAGETIDFSVSYTENLIVYELVDQSGNGVAAATLGDGSGLSFTTFPIASSVTSISLVASRIGTVCEETVGTINVSPEEINLTHIITTQPTNCPSPDGVITLSGLTASENYTLDYTLDGEAVPSAIITANGSGNYAMTGLAPGDYSNITISGTAVTLICDNVIVGPVSLVNAGAATLAVGVETGPSTCGGSDGSITFTSTELSTNYTLNYVLDGVPGSTAVSSDGAGGIAGFTGLSAGVYSSISITNTGTLCKSNSIGPFTLAVPNPTIAITGSASPASCGGNGTINFSFTDITDGTYTINYNGGSFASVAVASNVASVSAPAGSYVDLNITDITTGCTTDENPDVVLNDPATHTIAASRVNPTTCGGNGSINLTFTGVAVDGNYNIDYDGGQFTNVAIASNAATISTVAGTYNNLSLTYAGCVSAEFPDVVLTDPTKPTISLTSSSDPTTAGGTDGQIELVVTGVPDGSYTLNYQDEVPSAQTFTGVSIASGSATISGLSEGTYNDITITYNNCTSIADIDVVLSDPVVPIPSITGSTPSNPSTCGGTDGSIALTFNNVAAGTYSLDYHDGVGTASFSGVVVDGSGNATVSNLSAGTYNDITITVSSNTSVEDVDVVLTDPVKATIAEGTHTQPTNCAAPNGTIVLTGVTSGTYDVDFSFNGTPQSTQSITATASGISIAGLNNGAYTNLSITNPTTSCESNIIVGPINLANSSAPSGAGITPSATTLTCTTTTATLAASATDNSGTSNLTYAWTTADGTIDSGAATATATISAAGTYTVTITDPDNSCTTSTNQVISEDVSAPSGASITPTSTVLSTTVTTADLTASATDNSGTINLTYAWTTADGTIDSGAATATATVSSGGTYTVTISDPDNGCSTTAQQVITEDFVAPSPSTSGEPAAVNSTTPYDVTIDFGEIVTGFVVGDVTVGNGSATDFTDNGDGTYTVEITPSGAGDITVDVAANVAQDAAGNNNTAAATATTVYDTTAPSPSTSGEPAAVNSTTPYDVTIDFGEIVTGFVVGDVTVGNGSATDFTDNGDGTYTVEITPSGAGDITVDVAANVAQDAAGNNNTAAATATTVYDTTAPSPSTSGEPAAVNSTTPYDVTIDFGEIVTGFVVGDVTVGNGSATDFTDNGDGTYTVEITPSGAGDITVDVAANVAQDAAGNNNTAAATATTVYDTTAPSPSTSGEPAAVNSTTPYDVTIDFGEIVTGFVVGDVTVGNGSATDFTDNGDGTYTVEITPSGAGDITVDVAANVAQDAAGNNNTAATTATTVYDTTAPSPSTSGEPAAVNSTTPYDVTIDFGEIVTGFVVGDVTVGNGSATDFTDNGDGTYTVEITPSGAGDITVDVAANVAQDAAGNNNTAAATATTVYDTTAPSASTSGEPAAVNSTTPYDVTIDFGEIVTGFVVGDVTVGNGSATDFTDNGDGTYTVEITPSGAGDITVDVAANVAQDAAGNNNTAAATATTVYDTTAPSPSTSGEPAAVNSTTPYDVTIDFGEIVTGFVVGDVTVGNGSATDFTDNGDGTYTVEITPSGAGDITVDVAANVAQDAAGNNNTAAATATTVYDTTAPSASTSGEPAAVNSTTPYDVTIDFGEIVTGFVVGDVTVGNGSATDFTDNGDGTYTVEITPSGAGDITVDVAANVAQDAAGNNNTAAATATTVYDTTAPSASTSGEPAAVNSTTPYDVTIDFGEIVTGFVVGDVTVGNGSATDFTDNGDGTYTVEITPSGAGDITVDVAANVAQDAAGNNNTAAATATTVYDTTAPSPSTSGEPAAVNSTTPYDVTIDFGEIVTGFVVGDVTVGNGSATDFTDNGDGTYTVEITPSGAGDITVDVAANVAQDAAGNNNTAAATATTVYDTTAPSASTSGEPATVNSTTPYDVTIDFGEIVTGFVVGDVTVGNGSATDFTDNGDGTYTVEITPSGAGDITVDVAANVAQDAAGNNNTAAATATTVYDTTAPSPSTSGEPAAVNSTTPYDVTIDFGEIVTGFVVGDVTVGNGSATDFTDNGDGTYTVEITPSGAGDITVDVAANVAQDAAGNNNTAAATATTVYDTTAPSPSTSGEPAAVNSTTPYDVTIDFGEIVTGFVVGDVTVGNGSATDFTDNGDGTYTVEITPSGAGDITVDVAANVAQDAAGNNNTAATTATTVYDTTAPSASTSGEPAAVNSTTPYDVTIDFGEIVTGFVVGDVTVGNGSATDFTDNGDGTYTVEITPSGAGDITVDVAANVAQDAAGNNNTAAATATTVYDTTAPSPSTSGEPAAVNSTTPYDVTIDFGEIVTGFVVGDVTVGNGSATDFTDNGDGTYTVEITPSGAGDITVDVAANVAQDAAGNNNTAATTATTVYDTTAPSPSTSGEPAAVNSTTPYDVTIDFGEIVTGFVVGDVTVGNGSATDFTDNGDGTYTVEITPSGAGDITVDVAANVAQDAAGNNNTAAATATTVYDTTAPSASTSGEPAAVNSTTPYDVTIDFGEIVTGFVVGDVTVGNGSATDFTDNGDGTYTVEITPSGAGDITVDVAANVAQDAAGNNNTAAATATTVYDTTAPSASTSGEPAAVNSTTPYDVTIDFGEIVTGFVVGDVTVGNGSATDFTDNGDGTYTVEITPSGAGDITVDVAANVAQDAAGNNNTAATTATTVYDTTAPSPSTSGEPAAVNSTTPYDVTIDFGEIVTGFVVGDVTVGNGSATDFTDNGDGTYTVEITPSGAGDITVDVAANVAQDAAGNNNTAAATATTVYDTTAPSASTSGEPAAVNSTTPYDVTIDFGEIVTGFVVGDVTVGNGSATDFTDNGDGTYTVEITPSGAGDITVDVAANVAQDAAGNNNTAATTATTVYDTTAPSPSTSGEPAAVNSTTPYDVTIDFGEIVTGFVVGDVTVGNGSATDFTDNGDGTYTVEITPSGAGDITVDVAANVAQDAAGNNNTAAATATTVYDTTAPSASTSGEPAAVNSTTPYDVTIDFGEIVTGFVVGDVTVGNGSATDFTDNGDGTYTVEITPSGAGDITVDVAANVAQDAAGNNNTAATTATTVYDTTAPSPSTSGEPAAVNSTTPYDVTIDFGEIVTGFVVGDVTVGNGSATDFTDNGDGTYTVEITPSGAGDITVDVAANVAQDAAGNNNTAAATATTVYDTTAPVIVIDTIAGDDIINAIEDNTDVTVSGTTTGVEDGQMITITLNGLNYMATVIGNVWSLDIPAVDVQALGEGDHDISANVSDAVGNPAIEVISTINYDTTAPTIIISTVADDDIINAIEDNTDVTVSGTTIGVEDGQTITVSLNGEDYDATVTGNTWTLDIPAADVQALTEGDNDITANVSDVAGNPATEATKTVDYDIIAPTITIATVAGDDIINAIEDNTDVTVSGTTTGVEDGQTITVSLNGEDYDATVTGNAWTLDIPAADVQALTEGDNDITANVSDVAGNPATEATKTVDYDVTPPEIPSVVSQITSDKTPTLEGTAEAGSTVTIEVGGATFEVTADASGNWTLNTNQTPTTGIFDPNVDGSNEVIVTSTDAAGNQTMDITALELIILANDSDGDNIPDIDEDLDGNGDPTDDDSDGDDIPDYLDEDDDGDGIDTKDEDVDSDDDPTNDDTDGDNIPDYLDTDDDGDGVESIDEDLDQDGNPANDDTDGDGIANYLDEDDDGDGIATTDEINGDCDRDGIPNELDADLCESPATVLNTVVSRNSPAPYDRLQIENIEDFPNNSVQIFNRWGNKVWDTKGYDNRGNAFFGSGSGTGILGSTGRLPVGTYFYLVDLGNGDDLIKGFVRVE
ncbi:MAG: Ig-like domain-containing protein [Reichenbachiella sp.]|uniref:Ig-like domain-containing protein n=1 Tax=Reichenbachiella sp. TaxID=2184521 RepID=UPI0029664475|nr:Ig-like domain-containing protein [Reichenbachiella sp.]MDW3211901.1 Ig-like domain-containing protein [Reichenbachiella sp.]